MIEPNTFICGDCMDVLKELPDDCVDMLWTDPPYGHSNHDGDFNARLNDFRGIENKPIENDDGESMRIVMDAMLVQAARFLKLDCCCCCCCCGGGGGPKPTFAWVANRLDSKGLSFFHSVIWDKINPGLGWRYRRQHEMIMVSHRVGGKLAWKDNDFAMPNIIKISAPREREHPNQKPIELVEAFILAHSKPGDLIIDPFCGSGTTAIACHRTGRRFICIDKEPEYIAIAKRRYAEAVAQIEMFQVAQKEPEQMSIL